MLTTSKDAILNLVVENKKDSSATGEWIIKFKGFYADLLKSELAELDTLYTPDVQFKDPVHSIEGRAALYKYFEHTCGDLSHCQFEYLDQLVEPGRAYIKWNMRFRHPKLHGNRLIDVRGASQILFNDKGIYFHEDFYDLGAMLYENVPMLGSVLRWLKRRMALCG